VEWRSVEEGLRACAIARLELETFVERVGEWAEHGLSALPLALDAVGEGPYSNAAVAARPGGPAIIRVAIGSLENLVNFRRSMGAADDRAIGELLGYPACCREFFRQTWAVEGLRDMSWPMALRSDPKREGNSLLSVEGADFANILWRWMGIRAVPHLPCSFSCGETVRFAEKLVAVGERAGLKAEMAWLKEILSWPVEWSALHGIAEIKTPILRVSTSTDIAHELRAIRRKGSSYPAEGAKGLHFPYRHPSRPKLTGSKAFVRGLDEVARSAVPRDDWFARDNGFPNVAAMNAAHAPIVQLASSVLGSERANVIDLGCGNGALLRSICARNPQLVPFGIDKDAQRIRHARVLFSNVAEHFHVDNLFGTQWPLVLAGRYAAAFLMPGRLVKAGPQRSQRLLQWLRRDCENIVLYCYNDWSDQPETLESLAQAAGFRLKEPGQRGVAALAEVAITDSI